MIYNLSFESGPRVAPCFVRFGTASFRDTPLALWPLEKPRDATHLSSRMTAKSTGLWQSAVIRIWHAFGLRPHRPESH